MIDPDAFAALLCDWCLDVRERQQVLVVSTTLADPAVRSLHRALLERGAWPLLRVAFAEMPRDFYTYARDWQLDEFPALELLEVESADAFVRINAPADTQMLTGIEPERVFRALRAREPIARTRLAGRWCGTIWPTAALAEQAGMGEEEYAAFLNRALFLDRADPVAAWGELSDRQEQLVRRLADAREIRIEGDGTDLRLAVAGRTWVNSDGHRNMPSGEVFTGPLEDSAEGTIRFTIPSTRQGVTVSGIELTFEAGKVVEARAGQGQQHLDLGARDRPGRALPWRARDRHQPRDRPRHRLDAAGREDRRHRPSRARALVSRDGRPQRVRPALGPDLRPPRRRPADRRRTRRSRYQPLNQVTQGPFSTVNRGCAAPRSSPPSGPPRAIPTRSRGWSRPGWTSRG